MSEYYTLIDDVAKSIKANTTDSSPATYVQIIQFLRDQEGYDESNLRERFGYAGRTQSVAWRTLKRATIERILLAIDKAKGNETPKAILQRIPNLIRVLAEKEIWERAEKLTDKYIQIATEIEEYSSLIDLLKLKQHFVFTYHRPAEAYEVLAELKERSQNAFATLNKEEQLNDIWLEMGLLARQGKEANMQRVRDLLSAVEEARSKVETKNSAMHVWNIRRVGSFLLEDNTGYIEALEGGADLGRKYIDDPDIFELLLHSLTDRAQNHLFAHQFAKANNLIAELLTIIQNGKIAPKRVARVESRIYILRMSGDFISVDSESIAKTTKEFDEWLKANRFALDERYWLKITYRVSFNQFIIGDFSSAAKWIFRLREKSPSRILPQMTHFAWVFFMIARFEQKEYDVFKREIRATKKYLAQNVDHPELYLHIVESLEKITNENDANAQRELKRTLATEIDEMLKSPQNQRFKYYFPYALWLRSDSLESFKLTLKKNSGPFLVGQK
jgi:RNase P subunit RPR2